MAANQRDGSKNLLDIAKTIYEALEPLDEESRRRVIASALSLLGSSGDTSISQRLPTSTTVSRPTSPIELLQEKKPSNNPERIALFAYYRERIEGKSRFSRSELEGYFSKFSLPPGQNYDRDFSNAIQLGYIYEDGSDSYLTTKG